MTCCELDFCVVSVLLHSVLPMELARDLRTQPDIERFKYSLLLLTVIFCSGEKPPNDVYGQINEDFVHFLLDQIENPLDDDQVKKFLINRERERELNAIRVLILFQV